MVKLGRISYVNMAPVFYRVDAEVDEVQGVPTELNRMLVAGELDTAPISSIEYARHADSLRLLPRSASRRRAPWTRSSSSRVSRSSRCAQSR
jgi:Predicted periplasmic solute-binding protein